MKILGLDPGSAKMGYGILSAKEDSFVYEASGILCPESQLTFPQKLHSLQSQLEAVVKKHNPSVLVIERAFFGKNAESAFKLGQVRGVCLSAAAGLGVRVYEVAARRAKKLVTGNGAAEKNHVQLIVGSLLGRSNFASYDESDALAMAIAFYRELLAAQVLKNNKSKQEVQL